MDVEGVYTYLPVHTSLYAYYLLFDSIRNYYCSKISEASARPPLFVNSILNMQAQEPVEMELSIILQRIRVKLEKHESPPVVLLNAMLECFGRPQVPLLSCCKVILASGLDTFIRIIREYDPNEYTKAFCLILSILRQLCRIGGRPAKGRQAVNDNDAIIGRIEENDAVIEDRNGYRIQGVIQTMLNAGIMNALLDAASSCSDDAVEAAIITFLCDFALEENVCEVALPEVLLFLSNNHRRTCKRTACILISRICSDSSAKMVLLDASANNIFYNSC